MQGKRLAVMSEAQDLICVQGFCPEEIVPWLVKQIDYPAFNSGRALVALRLFNQGYKLGFVCEQLELLMAGIRAEKKRLAQDQQLGFLTPAPEQRYSKKG